jgi:tRNA threonylcarbamoyladenosine biosynthesis protein TsaE
VRSPTYTLLESYQLPSCILLHLDLYRLSDPEELEFLGLREELEPRALCLIEWPERGGGHLPPPDLTVVLQHRNGGREAAFDAGSAAGHRCLQRLPSS